MPTLSTMLARPYLDTEEAGQARATLQQTREILRVWRDALLSASYPQLFDAPANPMAREGRYRSYALPRLRVKTRSSPPIDYFSAVGVLFDSSALLLESLALFNYWDYANTKYEAHNPSFLEIPWRVGFHVSPETRSLATGDNFPRVLSRFLNIPTEQFLIWGSSDHSHAANSLTDYLNGR